MVRFARVAKVPTEQSRHAVAAGAAEKVPAAQTTLQKKNPKKGLHEKKKKLQEKQMAKFIKKKVTDI